MDNTDTIEVRTNVIKRNGREVGFLEDKIIGAIEAANHEVSGIHQMNRYQIRAVADKIARQVADYTHAVHVEDIQDMVETGIMEMRCYEVAQKYVRYRYKRELSRKSNTTDNGILALIDQLNEEVKQENSNKNPVINSTQRDYMAGEVSKDLTRRVLLPEDVIKAHEEGIIHFHDTDYFAQREHNCDLINLEDMLQNGTVISEAMIEKPHSFFTACNVTTQIVAQVASNQYGGQSFTLAHLAPFVDISRKKIREQVVEERVDCGEPLDDEIIDKITEKRLGYEIRSGIQTIQYQLITLMTCNGQAPFVTMFMYLDEVPEGRTRDDLAMIIREVMVQRMQGVKNEKGVWVTPAFPKLIYVLDEDNIHEDSKYYDLTELAAKCTAKRMVPDYISAKIMRELKGGNVYTCMGCRSFLTPDRSYKIGNIANAGNFEEGKPKFYGRFNQGVVTINLVDVACTAAGDMDKFWGILDERLELCHKALRCRHERLRGTLSDVAPILWQHGALARLEKGQRIDELLYNGYSTISLGYAGLYEMCHRMLGVSHTDPMGKEFALKVMQRMNDKCAEWKAAENIDYSVYGTPLESTTYKFAKCLQKR
ncbi:MAG: anaerobic ribonucleoside-triphosphate reductase, partial [Lachnospiraceae bacterium]|nr:anaerobic ribonucleoside-triphosphate reductase [Lachnospiraceae bacterium]